MVGDAKFSEAQDLKVVVRFFFLEVVSFLLF